MLWRSSKGPMDRGRSATDVRRFSSRRRKLPEKTARFLAKAVTDSVALPLGDVGKLRQIAGRVSALILTMWSDAASTNRRYLKHVCGLRLEQQWPQNMLVDPSQKCLLHQLHRAKTIQLEGHTLVSLAYCFAKLIRSGSILGLVSQGMIDRNGAR